MARPEDTKALADGMKSLTDAVKLLTQQQASQKSADIDRDVATQKEKELRTSQKLLENERRRTTEARAALVTGAVAAAGAGVAGLANRGFRGTVEQARFNAAMDQASRQVAGLFKPAMDTATKGIEKFSSYMKGLNGNQQNAVGAVTGVAALYAGYRGVAGLAARAFGMAGGAGAAGAGAAGVGSGAVTAGTVGAAAGGIRGKLGGMVKGAGVATLAVLAAEEALDDDGFYEGRKRRAAAGLGGKSTILGSERLANVGHGVNALGDQVLNLFSGGKHAEKARAAGYLGGKPADHRDVTMAASGFEELGGGMERITNAANLTYDPATTVGSAGGEAVGAAVAGLGVKLDELIAAVREGKVPGPLVYHHPH